MDDIYYSDKYNDDTFEYRHVILPKSIAKSLPGRLLSEAEWRRIGVQQSLGWQHYLIHNPEKHILLFRRKIGFNKQDEKLARENLEKEMREYEAKYQRIK
ncbi:unnamed protein product [Caenorhabditis angaria]|uniref:Cyclin-dependent kinases regulatory subunit n=1 Tax=Caenorhabditis angaria TaxID=860376 RepID=A0A9P1IHU8_9PELO|nr:unnamed protein product [Caenorhabditis angaria]